MLYSPNPIGACPFPCTTLSLRMMYFLPVDAYPMWTYLTRLASSTMRWPVKQFQKPWWRCGTLLPTLRGTICNPPQTHRYWFSDYTSNFNRDEHERRFLSSRVATYPRSLRVLLQRWLQGICVDKKFLAFQQVCHPTGPVASRRGGSGNGRNDVVC